MEIEIDSVYSVKFTKYGKKKELYRHLYFVTRNFISNQVYEVKIN